jgi:hypothetical protein
MISVTCPSCKKVHKADKSLLGKRVKCKDCGATFDVTLNMPRPVQQPNAGEVEQMVTAALSAVAGPTRGDISKELVELPKDMSSTKSQKPFGLVWVVFYWIFAGVICLPGGYFVTWLGITMSSTNAIIQGMFGSRGFLGSPFGMPALATALLELLGLLVFHYGLLLLVACYGLWTFRKWGLSLARGMAIAFVVLNLVVIIISLVCRAGIMASLVGLVISAGILVYLYGSANLRDRLQEYIRAGGF